MKTMFRPEPDIEYSMLLNTGMLLDITFTTDNDVYPEEEYLDFDSYECYDSQDTRYICYTRVCECDVDLENYCIVLKTKNIDGYKFEYNVNKIYLNDKLIYCENKLLEM